MAKLLKQYSLIGSNDKFKISTPTEPTTTKLGKVVKIECSHVPLWSRSSDIPQQNTNLYISTSTRPKSIKLGTVVTLVSGDLGQGHISLSSCGYVMSRNKIKPLYLHSYKSYNHQIWHNEDLGWWPPPHKTIWPLIMWSYDATGPNRNILSPISQDLLPRNLAEWWLRATGSQPLSKSYDPFFT